MVSCAYCGSGKIVKNGIKAPGEQSYRCDDCRRYFTESTNPEYRKSHFHSEMINLTVLWYHRYALSYRNIAEMMLTRGMDVSHQSIYRWVLAFGGGMAVKARAYRRPKRTVSWYVDETYVKVKGVWKYLYRAVDRNGEVLDVMLSAHRSKKGGDAVFQENLEGSRNQAGTCLHRQKTKPSRNQPRMF